MLLTLFILIFPSHLIPINVWRRFLEDEHVSQGDLSPAPISDQLHISVIPEHLPRKELPVFESEVQHELPKLESFSFSSLFAVPNRLHTTV
jgi:hypothetical protein